MSIPFSIISHIQRPKDVELSTPKLHVKEVIERKLIWELSLSKLPQFESIRATSSIESSPNISIDSATLIGVTLDVPQQAIVMPPESGKVLRIGLGDGWLPGWVLKETKPNYVIWLEESSGKQHKQSLFSAIENVNG